MIKDKIAKLNIHECDIEDIFEILDNQPDYKQMYVDSLKQLIKKNETIESQQYAIGFMLMTNVVIIFIFLLLLFNTVLPFLGK